MRLIIFDFCDTLVNFQSADSFVRFSLNKNLTWNSALIQSVDKVFSQLRIYSILRKLKVSKSIQKQMLLKGLIGLSREEIAGLATQFENEIIQKSLNPSIYDLLIGHIKNGDEIIINSGGYQVYLDVFAAKLGIKKVYATQLEFIENKFNGQILGQDCLYDEKITRMLDDGIDFKAYSEILVYSDSVTDLPIFNIATKKFAVIKGDSVPEWCNNTSFQILKV